MKRRPGSYDPGLLLSACEGAYVVAVLKDYFRLPPPDGRDRECEGEREGEGLEEGLLDLAWLVR